MATNQLALYNAALFACGEQAIASLSEDREPRRLLDEIWSRGGGATRYVLEQGTWDFASRSVVITASGSVTPAFGFSYAFDVPTDYVRLIDVSSDEEFGSGLFYYQFEGAYIFANATPLYLRYVSDDASYGGDLALWPDTFILWVGHWLATQLAPRVKNDVDMLLLERRTSTLLLSARLKNTSQSAPPFPPIGADEIDHRHLDHVLELLTIRDRSKKETA